MSKFLKISSIVDVTGTMLSPSIDGDDCIGNGKHTDEFGNTIECCCDECDYLMLCYDENSGYVDDSEIDWDNIGI